MIVICTYCGVPTACYARDVTGRPVPCCLKCKAGA